MAGQELAGRVTCPKPYGWGKGSVEVAISPWSEQMGESDAKPESSKHRVLAFDYGIKQNILRLLVDHNCDVWEQAQNVLRSEEHTSELQSQSNLVCRLLLEKKNNPTNERMQGEHLTRLGVEPEGRAQHPDESGAACHFDRKGHPKCDPEHQTNGSTGTDGLR